ncbi:efflux RND transporter periplasmic adaptor subunit [Pseudoteredinibacter isoporae]|uniref:RND family efflux transporter MFP subunit n=1 Tax=Pseudoteredinibacter isoporae TaxID=570281 RepID=A0A7X0JS76_9GAMM|nr:efflux RND transporter periplasmic adaptor subunit [Pseudoteredinibacter isoporae]MBB6520376.1 RND family efflux transporter MFP subunit [Pseudoteredinibacter isoporae]NHO85945.1 efflux RND transporter periplasmic adaptor subunit [Pseudoteredinibacter isoporae]NIB25603.1 efflux RND transporter periplasmic adaptor subunit [Pseudoteredinibacter isoporae]
MRKRLLSVAIVAAFAILIFVISSNPPSAERRGGKPPADIAVDVKAVEAREYTIKLDSYGLIRPRTQTQLLPQVSAQVTWVSPQFRAGGFFEEGEALLRLEDRDYQVALIRAEASLASAKQLLSEEEARVKQAKADWKRSGKKGEAPDIVVRKPQLRAAQANVQSAAASLSQAKLDVERTHIRAPFAGRVLSKSVDLGQFVSSGTVLATIYGVDTIEVRLPIKSRDLAYIQLPERYRFNQTSEDKPAVEFISTLIRPEHWFGQVIETEGAIDSGSRQLYVIAEIKDPYGAAALTDGEQKKAPLKIGQYVQAKINGKTLNDAIVIPNRVIYQGSYVYVEEGGKLQRRDIHIAWQNEQEALIDEGLQVGDMLVTTSLGQLPSGTAVRVIKDKPDKRRASAGQKNKESRKGKTEGRGPQLGKSRQLGERGEQTAPQKNNVETSAANGQRGES